MGCSRPLTPLQGVWCWETLRLSVLMGTVLLSAVGVVYTQQRVRGFYSQLQGLEKEGEALQEERSRLLLEQGAWSRDARVEKIAREKLGMVLPEQKEIKVITP